LKTALTDEARSALEEYAMGLPQLLMTEAGEGDGSTRGVGADE
jgi:hypothetical protein